MTDETPINSDTEAEIEAEATYSVDKDPDGLTRDQVVAKDWLLDDLLDFLLGPGEEERDASFSLSLNFSGLLVSGLAITRGTWAKGVLGALPEHIATTRDALETVWTNDTKNSTEVTESRRERKLPARVRQSVHFKDAQVWVPGGPVNYPFWRGSLKDVTGWSMGSHNLPE